MQGHVRKRGGTWSLVIDVGDEPARNCDNGCKRVRVWVDDDEREDCPRCGGTLSSPTMMRRQRWRAGFRTKKEAQDALRRALGRVDSGQEALPPKITLGQFVDRWLAHLDTQGKPRPQTVRRYREVLSTYVVPLVGGVQLFRLRPGHLQTCFDAMSDQGLAPATVSKARAATSSMLQTALRWELVTTNVARATTVPTGPEVKLRTPTPAELRFAIAAAVGTTWEVPVLIAATTGARRSEILAMRWSKIDLGAGRARIAAGLQRVDGDLVFTKPKTTAGARVVPLPPLAVERLRAHKAAQARRRLQLGTDWQDLDLVCERGDGGPVDPSSFTHGWARIAKVAGLDGVRLHDLRHGVATSLARSGARPSVTAAVLGHSNPAFTARVYEHPDEVMLDEAAAKLAEALEQG